MSDQKTEARIDFGGRIRRDARTKQGGARITANVTRTGVLEYTNADGSVRRELRHPDEVFSADSLASLDDAHVTIGHPGKVGPSNFKDLSVGHARNPRRDGKMVAADLVISREDALSKIDSGDLVECSMAYDVVLVHESGVYEGEKFDCQQTKITYNAVGLGPSGWGRAGSEVRMRLDGVAVSVEDVARPTSKMADKDNDLQARLDAATSDFKTARTERDDAKARATKLEQELATSENAHKATLAKLDAAEKSSATAQDRIDAAAEERVAILEGAALVAGKRVDGKGKKNRDLMLAAVVAEDTDFKADGKSDDYVRARFDGAVERAVKAGKSLASVNATSGAAGETTHEDAQAIAIDNVFDIARTDFESRRLELWQTPDPRLASGED